LFLASDSERCRSVVPVVADYGPIEQDIFHLWSVADVVHHHVVTASPSPVDNHADVSDSAAEIPSHNVARGIVLASSRQSQGFAFPRKEEHQIRYPPVVNVRVGGPAPVVRIDIEVLNHIFMNFFLQVYANRAVNADDLVGANAGVRRNIAARIWNPNVPRNIPDVVVRAFNRRGDQFAR
jgi:hypothetical protein